MANIHFISSALPAASEPEATAVLLLVLGVLVAISVLFSREVDRLGVPVVLLLLMLGIIGGSEGFGGIAFSDYHLSARLGTIALIFILFDGGLNTSAEALRQALVPASALATAGVALTAGLVALFARLLGLPWSQAILLGAVVSPTDAAAVYAVLRGSGLRLKPRVGNTLELESCINDPMAMILTIGTIQVLASGRAPGWELLLEVPVQLGVGAGVGLIFGYIGRFLLRHAPVTTVGLFPALTLALAFTSFGLATLVRGSGFLAVFITAFVLGAGFLPYRSGLARVHDALAWLSQIAMFLMLGFLVFPSQLRPVTGVGIAIGLFLAIVARPVAVAFCLWPFRYKRSEVGYIGWVGLRGAVPIILATFPVLADVPGAHHVFNVVFFVVLVNSLIPGSTIRSVTKRFGMGASEKPRPPAVLEVNAAHPLGGELVSFYIEPALAVSDARLSEIEFPPGAAIVLIVRGQSLVAARGSTVLKPRDHVYVFFHPRDRTFIELLFGRPDAG
jgi:cell volume regulation protein A